MTGVVQGVGFRPFVHRQAGALGLAGWVANDEHGVVVEAQGPPAVLDELERRLRAEAPARAAVTGVSSVGVDRVSGTDAFTIRASSSSHDDDAAAAGAVVVGADLAVCRACLAEVDDPRDRRSGYPFTNCTECGPRFTIVRAAPYDRATTTMAGFTMCPACRREYEDPADRRFHAQPNACPECGPRLAYESPPGRVEHGGPAALEAAGAALRAGAVLGVKGIGGYHLAVDAGDAEAVARLRSRKRRDDKPFAVVVADVEAARSLVELDDEAAAALVGPAAPIVVAPRRPDAAVAPGVAPGLPELGVLLAYTPLHHLLLAAVGRPLVLTSANVTDEPIVHRDDDARERLASLVDGLVTHDRPIHVACEDSVVRAAPWGLQVLRRGRGLAPEPRSLGAAATATAAAPPLLAVGAELKSTVSLASAGRVVTSPHLGDLEHLAAHRAFTVAVDHLCELFRVTPGLVAHDAHPEYLSTKWALDSGLATIAVQHHHAHVVSCLVDHDRPGPVLGVAFDGLGYGDDGDLWGGELLVADRHRARRVAHLLPVPLAGGSAAIREPWRMAVSWVSVALEPHTARSVASALDPRGADLLALCGGPDRPAPPSFPRTTSVGRLLDAVAALLGVRAVVRYEGQAAIELEAAARRVPRASAPAYPVEWHRSPGGPVVLDPRPLVAAVVAERAAGVPVPMIAAGVHEGLGRAAAERAVALARAEGLAEVVLTGGVFQNVRLTEVVAAGVEAAGLTVLRHRTVPPNDGGISVGQAAVAVARAQPVPSGPHRPTR